MQGQPEPTCGVWRGSGRYHRGRSGRWMWCRGRGVYAQARQPGFDNHQHGVAAFYRPDAPDGYMARDRIDSPMRESRPAEADSQARHHHHHHAARGKHYPSRRGRSPSPHRHHLASSQSRPDRGEGRDWYPNSGRRGRSSDSYQSQSRRSPLSPVRSTTTAVADRRRRPNNDHRYAQAASVSHSTKRRRTRSPSPARSDRIRDTGRSSVSRARSPDHSTSRDKRPGNTYQSPRRRSPIRNSRPVSRAESTDVDTYIPARRRHDLTSFPPRREKHSPSPALRRSRSPAPRHTASRRSPHRGRDSSPRSGRNFQASRRRKSPGTHSRSRATSRPASASDSREREHESMEGQYPSRGNYGHHNNMTHGRSRPFHDARGSYHGSPPYSTPNSSHHGSPQSNTSYHGGRGGWGGHGYPNHQSQSQSSPPYRQNSHPGAGQPQNQYMGNQQPYGGQPQPPYHQQNYRGGRGGHYQQQGSDRRYSGQFEHRGAHRGRGGHFNNLQWNAKRGSTTGGNLATGPNSIQASPALSQHSSRDPQDQSQDEEQSLKPAQAVQVDDQSRTKYSGGPKPFNTTQTKDASKFSFAFKAKQNQVTHSKPPPDLGIKAKGPYHSSDDRGPVNYPKSKPFEHRQDRASARTDQKYEYERDRRFTQHNRHPYTKEQRPRSRSPPFKKQKIEVKQKPQLSPEFAASDSVYYRKPGNESVVGAGTYGKVFKAIHIYTRDKVALKKIRMEGERDGFPITAVREIKLLQHLRHKHVVALQEVMVEKNECFMVFEYMSHDMTGLINHPTFQLTAAHKKDLARQMFSGLEYLHKRGVLHRDIKAANILISNTGQLKYADFGLARFYQKSRPLDYTNRVITIWYRPPELLLGETKYGPAVDVWSAACVFMEMFTKKAVFPGEGGELSQLDKVYTILGTPIQSEWPEVVDLPWFELVHPLLPRRKRILESTFKDSLTPATLDLVKSMFRYDPTKRPSAEEVLQHPYFIEEEPAPQQALELADVEGDWHEFESKAHRREHDKREKERKKEEYMREKEKRKAREAGLDSEGANKKSKPDQILGDDEDQEAPMEESDGEDPNIAEENRGARGEGDDDDDDDNGSARMSMS